jgi:hypothetical protein
LYLARAREVLESGWLIPGRNNRELEHGFARLVGSPHAVAVSSGTFALEIVMRAAGLAGSAVLVPANTNYATLARQCLAAGVVIVTGTTVAGITHADGKVTGVRLSSQHLSARHVVIAAGTGTTQLLSDVGSPQARLLRSRLDIMIHLPGAQLRRGLIFSAPDRPVMMPALGGGALVSFFGGRQPEITGRRAFSVDLGKATMLLSETLRSLSPGTVTAAGDHTVAYVAGKTDYVGVPHAENGTINPGYHVIDHERTDGLYGLHTVITGKMTLGFHASKTVADSITGTRLPLALKQVPTADPSPRLIAVEPWAAPARL